MEKKSYTTIILDLDLPSSTSTIGIWFAISPLAWCRTAHVPSRQNG